MPDQGPFHHQATNRRCWWSESQKRYVFDDGTPVPMPASAAQSSGGALRSTPGGDAAFRAPYLPQSSPSNAQSIPRYLPPVSAAAPPPPPAPPLPLSPAQPTALYVGPSQPSGAPVVSIDWIRWLPGQAFGEGDTILIRGDCDPPVKIGRHLGDGSFATVLLVQVQGSSSVCALKIYKSRPALNLISFRRTFENEIHNMRRVSNRHIARFFGAYICERSDQPPEFGILMQPVASGGTLEFVIATYRRDPSKLTQQLREILAKAFGCLSSALEFVHRHMIRHKDVKSDNILMHGGKVLLTDFGSSWAGVGDESLMTNTDHPQGYTPRYAAPEVIKKEPRSAKSDVFSLGGVFYEILSALEPRLKWFEGEYCKTNNTLRNAFVAWKNTLPEVTPLIYSMLDSDPGGRPSGRGLVEALPEKHFCAECWQDRRTLPALPRGSSSGHQLAGGMAGLSLSTNPSSAVTYAPSAMARPPATNAPPSATASSARRDSLSTSAGQRTVNYATRPQTRGGQRQRRNTDDDSDDDTE